MNIAQYIWSIQLGFGTPFIIIFALNNSVDMLLSHISKSFPTNLFMICSRDAARDAKALKEY